MKRVLWILLVAAAGALAQPTTDDGSINVPEPSSLILLGTAIGGVTYALWRHNRKK